MKYNLKDPEILYNPVLYIEYTLKVDLMTSNKVINAEQKNKHKIMKDVHIAETEC